MTAERSCLLVPPYTTFPAASLSVRRFSSLAVLRGVTFVSATTRECANANTHTVVARMVHANAGGLGECSGVGVFYSSFLQSRFCLRSIPQSVLHPHAL